LCQPGTVPEDVRTDRSGYTFGASRPGAASIGAVTAAPPA
jgi:hypothetical protein